MIKAYTYAAIGSDSSLLSPSFSSSYTSSSLSPVLVYSIFY